MQRTITGLIDSACYDDADRSHRAHLGGSLIGRKCSRELWYNFRWAHQENHQGRMLRLFARGQREEDQFIKLLRRIGVDVNEFSDQLYYHAESDSYVTTPARFIDEPAEEPQIEALCTDVTGDPVHRERAEAKGVKLKQWRISDVNGHFGGSLDGIAIRVPGLDASTRCLLEFKTHNTKSFVNMVNLGVKEAKPEHYAQMQIYMLKKDLKVALYCAVNKNDDSLHFEFVHLDVAFAQSLLEKANMVIHARTAPPRAGKHPSWIDCKWCAFQKICHFGEAPQKNCRSCRFAVPVDNGEWQCTKFNQLIPSDFIVKGCDNYQPIHD